jgi:hypothetical protein
VVYRMGLRNKAIDTRIPEILIQSIKFSWMSLKSESNMQFRLVASTWSSVLLVASVPVRGTGIGADLCEQVRMCCNVLISNTKTNLMSNCWITKYGRPELWHFFTY